MPPVKASGGDHTYDTRDGFRVHYFSTVGSSGALTVERGGAVDVLVVAGGGSGGSGGDGGAGGGGAGGVIYKSGLSVSDSTTYGITVGDGGAAPSSGDGNDGGNSTFGSSLTAIGGGGGGNKPNAGRSGGSGGGAGRDSGLSGGTGDQPSNTSDGTGYGNAGGNVGGNAWASAGGGGGASTAGGIGSPADGNNFDLTPGGNGGVGKTFAITGEVVTYGGGGGGAARDSIPGKGGVGGGGTGVVNISDSSYYTGAYASSINAEAGVEKSGGGGGGGWASSDLAAGAGGSGIVVIRYKLRVDDAGEGPVGLSVTDDVLNQANAGGSMQALGDYLGIQRNDGIVKMTDFRSAAPAQDTRMTHINSAYGLNVNDNGPYAGTGASATIASCVIDTGSLFKLAYQVPFRSVSADTRHIMRTWVEKNGSLIQPSETYCYVRTSGDGNRASNAACVLVKNCAHGDILAVKTKKDAGASGITVVERDAWVIVENISASANRFALLHDGTNEQDYDGGTVTVGLGQATHVGGRFAHSNNTRLRVFQKGRFRFDYVVNCRDDGQNSRQTPHTWLYVLGADGTNYDVLNSRAYSYIRLSSSSGNRNHATATGVIDLSADDEVEVRVTKFTGGGGASYTMANSCWLSLEELPAGSRVISAYRSVSNSQGTISTTGTWVAVALDSRSIIDSTHYSVSSDNKTFTVTRDGDYWIGYNLTWDDANNDRQIVRSALFVNGTELVPSRQHDYSRGLASNPSGPNRRNATSAQVFQRLSANDTIELRAYSDKSFTPVAEGGCTLSLEKKPTRNTPGAGGSRHLETLEFRWIETGNSHGGGVLLRDDQGTNVCGFYTNNPQWHVYDGSSFTQVYGSNGSEVWTRVNLTLDWSAGTFDYEVSDGSTTETGTFDLNGSRRNVTTLVITNYNDKILSNSSNMYMWFDDFRFTFGNGTERRLTFHTPDLSDWTIVNTNFGARSDRVYTSNYSIGITQDSAPAGDQATFPLSALMSSGWWGALDAIGLTKKPVVAYALRRLFGDYTGPQVRVRRSSDSRQAFVFFDAYGRVIAVNDDSGNHDNSLVSWLDGAEARVIQWYDQSGARRHAAPKVTMNDDPLLVGRDDEKFTVQFDAGIHPLVSEDSMASNFTGDWTIYSAMYTDKSSTHDYTWCTSEIGGNDYMTGFLWRAAGGNNLIEGADLPKASLMDASPFSSYNNHVFTFERNTAGGLRGYTNGSYRSSLDTNGKTGYQSIQLVSLGARYFGTDQENCGNTRQSCFVMFNYILPDNAIEQLTFA